MLAGNGLVNIALSFATSCSALWIFFTPFGRRKSYGPNSPIHTSLCVTSFLQRWFTGDPRAACSYANLLTKKRKRDTIRCLFSFLNQQLPILPGRFQPSTFGVYELNYCVRDGNRWFLVAIITEFVRVFPENYIEE